MRYILFLAFLLSTQLPVIAQSARDATPEETKALEKATTAVNHLIESFFDESWELRYDNRESSFSVRLAKTAHLEGGFEKQMVRKRTETEMKQIDAIAEKIRDLGQRQQLDSMKLLSKQLQGMREEKVTVSVTLSSPVLGLGTKPGMNQQLQVNGASKAFVVAEDNYAPDRKGTRVIAFGHWENSKASADHTSLQFSFARPPQTPYIENIIVELRGADEEINKMLQQINWAVLNEALTL